MASWARVGLTFITAEGLRSSFVDGAGGPGYHRGGRQAARPKKERVALKMLKRKKNCRKRLCFRKKVCFKKLLFGKGGKTFNKRLYFEINLDSAKALGGISNKI